MCYTVGMSAITIPKDLAAGDDLVLLPRKEYERLVARTPARGAKLTKAQRADLAHAREARTRGTLLSYDAFIRALAAPR